jgi:hypothetical protein
MKRRKKQRPFIGSRMYGFYRSRQIDGTMSEGSKYGTYELTACRVHVGWGAVSDRFWQTPRGAVIWPPVEPPGLDQVARFNRHLSHFRVRNLDDAKIAMAYSAGFICSVPITKAWRSAPGGVIPMPRDQSEFIEHHAIHALGYHDDFQQIRFWNNWGTAWGENSVGYLPYEYFEKYLTDAWFQYPAKLGHWRPDGTEEPSVERIRVFNNTLGNPSALIDLWSWADDVRVAWCIMTYRDGFLDVEDFFVRPEFYGSSHQARLTRAVLEFTAQQELPLRLWIAHADVRYCAANFRNLNDFLRTASLKPRPSPHSWAAYVAE